MLPLSVCVQFLPVSTVTQSANLTGTVTGIASIYLFSILGTNATPIVIYMASSYFGICLTLNLLVTLMIITKLILHRRNLQRAIGTSSAITGVYTTIVIMLVESYALYAIALLSDIVTSTTLQIAGVYITGKILSNVQVCTVFHFPNARAWNDIPPHRSLLHI